MGQIVIACYRPKRGKDAQLLRLMAEHVPILRSVGLATDRASIMGGNYPGGGITLGPAVTFGYIAARHISGAND